MNGCMPLSAMVRMFVVGGLIGMFGVTARDRSRMQRARHGGRPAGEKGGDQGQDQQQPVHGGGCRTAIGT